jgi:hypothetical protein
MNNLLWPFGAFAGMLLGILLYLLPVQLFYRSAAWVTEEELLAAAPRMWWPTRAPYVLLPAGFMLFVALMMSTDRTDGAIVAFFFFPLFFSCVGTVPAVPELVARVSVMIPLGHGSRTPVQYTLSRNAPRAAVLRLAAAALVISLFLWAR